MRAEQAPVDDPGVERTWVDVRLTQGLREALVRARR